MTDLTSEQFARCWNKMVEADTPLKDFNGHFWIEKDGEILDDYPWHLEMADFKRAFGIRNKKAKLHYDVCDVPTTNTLVFRILDKKLGESGLPVDECKRYIGMYWTTPEKCLCMFNATARQQREGGTIRFGSVYMMSDDGTRKHYISGAPSPKTLNDFKKQYNPYSSLL